MDFIIFIIGFLVCMTVVYGIFSQVPAEISSPEVVVEKVPEEPNS